MPSPAGEVFETLVEAGGVRVERIVTAGQTTPEGEWWDQDWRESVCVLRGRVTIRFADGKLEVCRLRGGGYEHVAVSGALPSIDLDEPAGFLEERTTS